MCKIFMIGRTLVVHYHVRVCWRLQFHRDIFFWVSPQSPVLQNPDQYAPWVHDTEAIVALFVLRIMTCQSYQMECTFQKATFYQPPQRTYKDWHLRCMPCSSLSYPSIVHGESLQLIARNRGFSTRSPIIPCIYWNVMQYARDRRDLHGNELRIGNCAWYSKKRICWYKNINLGDSLYWSPCHLSHGSCVKSTHQVMYG